MAVRQQIGADERLHTTNWSALREQPKQPGERIANEYAELKGLVKGAGLLDAQPAYYARKMIITLGMLAVSLAVLVTRHPLWLHLANAASWRSSSPNWASSSMTSATGPSPGPRGATPSTGWSSATCSPASVAPGGRMGTMPTTATPTR